MNKGPHYIYYLYDKNGLLAEIGRSIKPATRLRIKQRKHGEQFTMQISKPIQDLDDACEAERCEIRRFKPRLNIRIQSTRGAFGKPVNKGVPKSAAQIAKLTGPGNGMYGKQHAEATRYKMSAVSKNKPKSPEHRANMTKANRSDKRRAEVSAQKKGVALSTSHRNNIRIALSDPHSKANMSDARRTVWKKPSYQKKISKARKAMWQDPAYVAKITEKRKQTAADPAYIQKQKDAAHRRKLLRSGYGHPWRIKDLDNQTQAFINAA